MFALEKLSHAGEGALDLVGELVDHLRTPALVLLALGDGASDVPVEREERAVDRERGAYLRLADVRLQRIDEGAEAVGEVGHHRRSFSSIG